jgi:signal transduction histidine kinase
MAELLRQVAALPPDTIVYYLYMSEDGNGVHYVSVNAMREVAARASRPTYHWVAFTLGDGIVGGRMFDIEVVMKALADHVLRVLNGASPDSLPVREIDGTSQAYDWRALRRWGISEARLPVGSTVLFRQPSVWDQYKGYVAGAVALIVLQSALIGALVTQRMRRRRAELALLERERDAREAADQNRDLAGRLITAQEAERTRIARDLHDDLGQQMAGIGIILSGLKRKLGERAAPEALSATVEGLQDRTTSVTESIRHISHELHPTVLVHAGLGATLRRHCESIDEHRNVSVTYRTNDECDLRGDAALCLFRVAQEALANAVRHSGANRIHVELTSTHTRIELSIADDGCGFVPGSGTGLGLRSMAERVRLEHGTLAVESRIGHGTTLRASIPRAAVASGSRIPADTLA